MTKPLVEPNKIGIDTGAVYGNKLTCVQLPEEIFYSGLKTEQATNHA
ncbi:MAG: hypothetical protein MZV70_40305 [Desulfobacterales bacterium]|nr:hypothetical protein [Desulfobacterales bacterium]